MIVQHYFTTTGEDEGKGTCQIFFPDGGLCLEARYEVECGQGKGIEVTRFFKVSEEDAHELAEWACSEVMGERTFSTQELQEYACPVEGLPGSEKKPIEAKWVEPVLKDLMGRAFNFVGEMLGVTPESLGDDFDVWMHSEDGKFFITVNDVKYEVEMTFKKVK